MKPNRLRALQFVATHPGTWSNAFPCGYAYRFDAPEYKRVPFRKQTLWWLIDMGYVDRVPDGSIAATTKGLAALNQTPTLPNTSAPTEHL